MHTKMKNDKNNEELEDTKGVIGIRKSKKDRQRNYSLCCV